MQASVFLMYHELELPGRALCHSEPGYMRYILKASDFQAQMRCLQEMGISGLSVSKALTFPANSSVAVTFDDGCETDLLAAAPILRELGFQATFYITAGFLGRRGYLSTAQLRQLADFGFEIGCHSMTHSYLSDLDESGLHREIVESKKKLEEILGRAVEHFSCPGGRYGQRAIEVARAAGYRTLATSRMQANSRSTDPFSLGRVAVLRDMDLQRFRNICCGRGLGRLRLLDLTRTAAKAVMGNSAYDRMRGLMLGRSKGSNTATR